MLFFIIHVCVCKCVLINYFTSLLKINLSDKIMYVFCYGINVIFHFVQDLRLMEGNFFYKEGGKLCFWM